MNLIQPPLPEISDDGKTKEKALILIGAIVLVAAGFYFAFYKGGSISGPNMASPKDEVKLIKQDNKAMDGSVVSVDLKNKTFILNADKNYTVAVFPETVWVDFKSIADLKPGTKIKIDYIDAQKEVGLLYASRVEKIK